MVIELIFDVLFQLLIEVGWETVAHTGRRRKAANWFAAALGFALAGSVVGFVSLFVIPHRLLPPTGVRGASLLLSPLATGLLMRTYGEFRRRRDLPTSNLATFWGGATFAFFMALVRFLGPPTLMPSACMR